MLHDVIIFFALGAVAGFFSILFFALFRAEKFQSKKDWWTNEGLILFALLWIVMLIIVVGNGSFHFLH